MNNDKHIFTISELNATARSLLEQHFGVIWVEGEISNFIKPSSGHWYFSLKDENAQVRCAMFKGHNHLMKFMPEDGMRTLARARVSLYENRGDYQLIVEQLEDIGLGALQRAFEQLKEKLDKAGLFDSEHKKPLPQFPTCIGVVTSPTGAAIKDILSVLKRRYPYAPVIIYPTLVQGDTAAPEIVKAIEIANQRNECDVLLVSRGGGSLEDLWPFNEEIVARAIYASKIPVVTGIGHEIDFTIADFVADERAPTPSAAAELISPDQADILQTITKTQLHLAYVIQKQVKELSKTLQALSKRFIQCHPAVMLQQQTQTLDRLEQALFRSHTQLLERKSNQLKTLSSQLQQHNPTHRLKQTQLKITSLNAQLINAIKQSVTQKQYQLKNIASTLNTVNPLNTLQRGYAVVTDEHNHIIQDSKSLQKGDRITTRLAKGQLKCLVDEII